MHLQKPQQRVSRQLSLTRHCSLHNKLQGAAVKSLGFACWRLAYFVSRPSLSTGALPFATSPVAFLGRTVHPPGHKISKSHSRQMKRVWNDLDMTWECARHFRFPSSKPFREALRLDSVSANLNLFVLGGHAGGHGGGLEQLATCREHSALLTS